MYRLFPIGACEYINEQSDTDLDGLSDHDEVHITQTSPVQADSDGDTQNDGDKTIAGTDPHQANSYFAAEPGASAYSENDFVISWPSATARVYSVCRGTNLWTTFESIATNLPATPPMNIFTDQMPQVKSPLYYKVGIEHPGE